MKYLLISSQRSGSSFLSYTLNNIFNENNDGPDEWIVNADTRKNLGLQSDYKIAHNTIMTNLKILLELMSPNSHRKAMYSHLGDPILLPNDIYAIHLIRRDTWAQAKSLWIMNNNLLPPHVGIYSRDLEVPVKLKADIKAIKNIAQELKFKKKIWYRALIKRSNILTVYYEDDLMNNELFIKNTIPKFESFFKLKGDLLIQGFPFKKTRELYKFINLNTSMDQKYKKKFYLYDVYLNSSLFSVEDFIYRFKKKYLIFNKK